MSTWREMTYYVLDSIKAISSDAKINEDHVLFILNHYRNFFIELLKLKDKLKQVSLDNYLTICLTFEKVESIPTLGCSNGYYLKSVLEIPSLVDSSLAKLYTHDYLSNTMEFVSRERFKSTGYNRFTTNIIYGTLGFDHHLYLKCLNPLFLYLESAKFTALFEDAMKAIELSASSCSDNSLEICDILDTNYPIDSKLIPELILAVTKELLGFYYRVADTSNNDRDDIADLVTYIKKNLKTDLAKLLTE